MGGCTGGWWIECEDRVEIGFVQTKEEKKTKRPDSLCY